MFEPDFDRLTLRRVLFYLIKDFLYTSCAFAWSLVLKPFIVSTSNFIWHYKFKAFQTWAHGRKFFKFFHWTIRSYDLSNQYEDKDAVSVTNSFPKPISYAYDTLLWVYPDSDSNYARAGAVLAETVLNEDVANKAVQFITYKGKVVSATSAFAIVFELVRDDAMIAVVTKAKQSNATECKYNITSGDKEYLGDLYLHSPLWYMALHSFGERLVNPMTNGNFADTRNIATTVSYLVQDHKKFQFLLRDAGEIVHYLDKNPECVIPVEPEKPIYKTIGFNPLPSHFESAMSVTGVAHSKMQKNEDTE